jgi:hypothetical protein
MQAVKINFLRYVQIRGREKTKRTIENGDENP